MSPELKSFLLAICSAGVASLNGEAPEAGDGEPAKRGRGRPPKGEPEPGKATVTVDELRELFAPLVKDGRQAEVQPIIKKYAPTGMKDFPVSDAAKVAAFKADIEALLM